MNQWDFHVVEREKLNNVTQKKVLSNEIFGNVKLCNVNFDYSLDISAAYYWVEFEKLA